MGVDVGVLREKMQLCLVAWGVCLNVCVSKCVCACVRARVCVCVC